MNIYTPISTPLPSPTPLPPEARVPDGMTLYAIGDVHGRADLLRLMVEQIKSDRAGTQDRAEIIFVGDYIDRGPASYAVIDQILDLQNDADFSITTLKGNHESLALQFLADPAVGQFWCHIGGRETLLSYGITAPAGLADIEDWEAVRRAFRAALPETHLRFLRRLGIYAERGDYIFVHAGLRPGIGLADQREWDMLWIRNEFLDHPSGFGKVIVHGHTPEDEPFVGPHRIGIDTGADVTHRLTGVKLFGSQRRLISVSNAPIRHSCSTERKVYQAARSLPEPPPSAAIQPVRVAGVAPAPRLRWAWTPATISALSAGIVTLAAVTYLAVPLVDGGPLSGPKPGVGTDAPLEIDDLIEQTDKAILAARRTQELAAASTKSLTRDAPNRGTEASANRPSDTGQPQSVEAKAPPGRRAPETRAVAAATPPAATAAATRAAAPTAPRAATAGRKVTASKVTASSTPKPAAPAKEPSEKASRPSRAALSTGPEASIPKEPEPRSRASPRGSRAPDAVADAPLATAQAPAQREDTRLAGGTAAAGTGLDPGVSSEPPATYTRSVPMKNANRIGQDDYPDASVQAGEEGVVGVRYVVDTRGRVSTCAATETSNHARLDKRTCDLIRRRFRFKPAVRNGQPVEEVREQRIRWMLCPGQDGWGMSGKNDQRSDRPCPA